MILTTRHVKAARALLAWSQSDLAEAAGLSEPTVARLEAADGILDGHPDAGEKIVQALVAAGVEFAGGEAPGVRLRLRRPRDEGIRPDQLTTENDC